MNAFERSCPFKIICVHAMSVEITSDNMITKILSGLDSIPTDFAAQDALSFDEELFEVSEEELRSLSELFPNYSHLLFPVS